MNGLAFWLRRAVPVVVALVVAAACGGGTPTGGSSPSAGSSATAKDTELTFYSGGDTNVQDLHEKQVIPGFQSSSGVKVTFTFLEHGTGAQGIYDRLKAQRDAGKQQWDIDLWEADTGYYTRPDDLFLTISDKDIPNLAKVPKAELDFVNNKAVPYRGSSVVVAYNSDKIANPPQTFDELISWIKANPGKFAYNEPSTGGSGDAFVIAMIYKYSDYSKYNGKPFSADNEKDWDQAFAALRDLGPSLYQKGVYPKGNAGTLDLLNRGEISMGTVWSDQATQALAGGTLPKTIKLTQINPALNGGAAYIGVPKGSTHKQAAFAYLNYLLDPNQQKLIVQGAMAGYPGIDWQYMPADARSRFAGADKEFRYWPGGTYGSDMQRLWHEKVAAAK